MISKAQVIKNNPEYKTLINAVINRYGMIGGLPGFVYCSDTHAFAMRYRKLIVKLLEQQADDFGQEVVEMVSNFGYFNKNGKSTMDNDDPRELYKYLGGGKCEQSAITNLMAWFAAEEVCRMFED